VSMLRAYIFRCGEAMMQGRSVNAAQKRFHDALVRIVGCIACRVAGRPHDIATIHHCDGKTKPDAHYLVIPLCAVCHQLGGNGYPARHINKAEFERAYGTEQELLALSQKILRENGYAGPMSRAGAVAQ